VPVVEGKVALLAQSPYLRLALSPEIMRGQWATRLLEPAALSRSWPPTRTRCALSGEQLFAIRRRAKLLWRYLTNGRGAVLLVIAVAPPSKASCTSLGSSEETLGRQERRAID